jgi:hypothetical protein
MRYRPRPLGHYKKIFVYFRDCLRILQNMRIKHDDQWLLEWALQSTSKGPLSRFQMPNMEKDARCNINKCVSRFIHIKARFQCWDLWVMGPPHFHYATFMSNNELTYLHQLHKEQLWVIRRHVVLRLARLEKNEGLANGKWVIARDTFGKKCSNHVI